MSFERLVAEHDRIDSVAQALGRMILHAVPSVNAILATRALLSTELTAHLAHEDSAIYPRLLAGGCESVAQTAHEFAEEFELLAHDWQIYLDEWDAESITADWAEFCNQTSAVMARLHSRIDRENALLYPAALQAGVIRLRA